MKIPLDPLTYSLSIVWFFALTLVSAGEERTPKVTVEVLNKERKGIEGATIKQGYFSSKYAPVFKTDQNGKVQVNASFHGMSVTAYAASIHTLTPGVVEPYVFIFPTSKTKPEDKEDVSSSPVSDGAVGDAGVLRVLDFNGEPLTNIEATIGNDKNEVREIQADTNGRVAIGKINKDATVKIRLKNAKASIEFVFKASAVAWPCEIVFPKFKGD